MTVIRDYPNDSLLFAEGAPPATPASGHVRIYAGVSGGMYAIDDAGVSTPMTGGGGGGGSGDVTGPASSVADRISVFSGTSGKVLKDGGVTVADLYFDVIAAPTISGGTVTLNCNSGKTRNFTVAMTANATLAVSGLSPAGRVTEFEAHIKQDGTGSRTLTLPVSFKPLGESDTAISSAANSVTILSAKTFDAGTSWQYAMQDSA